VRRIIADRRKQRSRRPHRLTPLAPFETERPGHERGPLTGGYATQICKGMDFPGTVRGAGRSAADARPAQ